MKDILKLVSYLKKIGLKKRTILMHCVSSYPVKNTEANLNSIKFLKSKLNIEIGYSDHTIGIVAPIIAYCFGAKIIEKHFTLDNNLSNFRDHKLSLNPMDMKKMISALNEAKHMIGSLKKELSNSEKHNFKSMRRSFYADQNINVGERITNEKIKFVRPFKNSLEKKFLLKKKARIKILKNNIIIKKDLI